MTLCTVCMNKETNTKKYTEENPLLGGKNVVRRALESHRKFVNEKEIKKKKRENHLRYRIGD